MIAFGTPIDFKREFLTHPCSQVASLVAQLVKNVCNAGPWFDSWVGKISWRRDRLPLPVFLGFPGGSAGKESACSAGDLGSIPGLGRSPGGGKGYPLQYSGLKNSMACIVHGVAKSRTRLSDCHFQVVGGGWCTEGGRRGGSEKGMSKVIKGPANIKVKIKAKPLKFRVLKSPLKHFKLFPLYNLQWGFGDSSQRQVTLKHTTPNWRERSSGSWNAGSVQTERQRGLRNGGGGELEDATRKLPSSPPSLLQSQCRIHIQLASAFCMQLTTLSLCLHHSLGEHEFERRWALFQDTWEPESGKFT